MKKSYPGIVYLNGEWVTHDQAKISVFDRGFIFGDGVYEVISFYDGRPFLMEEHLQRLRNSLSVAELVVDLNTIPEIIYEAVKRVGLTSSDCLVYLQVTRGVAPRMHHYPEDSTPTIMAYAYNFEFGSYKHKMIKVFVAEDERWHRCDVKTTSLMGNVRANNAGAKAGAHETILVRNGEFTEGSHSNLFFVKNGELFTHPNGHHILPGITRGKVLELCHELNLKVYEQALPLAGFGSVDEAFITGTGSEVQGIGSVILSGKEIQISSDAGPVTTKLQEAFEKLTRSGS